MSGTKPKKPSKVTCTSDIEAFRAKKQVKDKHPDRRLSAAPSSYRKLKNAAQLAYNTRAALDLAITQYFDGCKVEGKTPTMSGLAYELGVDRHSLVNWSTSQAFHAVIKKAKTRIERAYEDLLLSGRAPVGAIFALKNNCGWADTSSQDKGFVINIAIDPKVQS